MHDIQPIVYLYVYIYMYIYMYIYIILHFYLFYINITFLRVILRGIDTFRYIGLQFLACDL